MLGRRFSIFYRPFFAAKRNAKFAGKTSFWAIRVYYCNSLIENEKSQPVRVGFFIFYLRFEASVS